jgi:hypothetical protein
MANESVTELSPADFGPKAFRGYDASVFRDWAAAVSDVIACGVDNAAPQSVTTAFGLVYQLLQASEELDTAERARIMTKARP